MCSRGIPNYHVMSLVITSLLPNKRQVNLSCFSSFSFQSLLETLTLLYFRVLYLGSLRLFIVPCASNSLSKDCVVVAVTIHRKLSSCWPRERQTGNENTVILQRWGFCVWFRTGDRLHGQKRVSPLQASFLAVVEAISGCVRIAIMRKSLLQVVNSLMQVDCQDFNLLPSPKLFRYSCI